MNTSLDVGVPAARIIRIPICLVLPVYKSLTVLMPLPFHFLKCEGELVFSQ